MMVRVRDVRPKCDCPHPSLFSPKINLVKEHARCQASSEITDTLHPPLDEEDDSLPDLDADDDGPPDLDDGDDDGDDMPGLEDADGDSCDLSSH